MKTQTKKRIKKPATVGTKLSVLLKEKTAEKKMSFTRQKLKQMTKPNEIKKRITTHKTTMKSKPGEKNYHKYVNSTEKSKLVHILKNKNQPYEIEWNTN